MKIKLLILFFTISFCISSLSCSRSGKEDSEKVLLSCENALLAQSEDMGEEYINSIIFFGESTTYHMKSRGVLKGGTSTKQVWAPKSGTVNLDHTTRSLKIVYPNTDTLMTVAEAAAISSPKYLIMTFGLNGAVQKINRGEEYYREAYLSLINSVRTASPNTKIILQSAFPISESMDTSAFTVNSATLNSYIDKINGWTLKLASDEGLKYLNTAEILKNDKGYLADLHDAGRTGYASGTLHRGCESSAQDVL